MASKGQASSSEQPDSREKKPKVEEEKDIWSTTLEMLKTAPKEKPPAKIDRKCPLSKAPGARVYEDYDCTLNLTNISANNNKFRIIQLLEHGGKYGVWSRGGRVGYDGLAMPIQWTSSSAAAKKDFEKKFRRMTKNSWATGEDFRPKDGKYRLIEVEREVDLTWAGGGDYPDDVKKMLPWKLSMQQIARGYGALKRLERALKKKEDTRLEELSSRFYTIVPHNFKKLKPPTIDSPDLLRAKKDMLLELAKIALAQCPQPQKIKEEEEEEEKEVANPLDEDYARFFYRFSQLDLAEEI